MNVPTHDEDGRAEHQEQQRRLAVGGDRVPEELDRHVVGVGRVEAAAAADPVEERAEGDGQRTEQRQQRTEPVGRPGGDDLPSPAVSIVVAGARQASARCSAAIARSSAAATRSSRPGGSNDPSSRWSVMSHLQHRTDAALFPTAVRLTPAPRRDGTVRRACSWRPSPSPSTGSRGDLVLDRPDQLNPLSSQHAGRDRGSGTLARPPRRPEGRRGVRSWTGVLRRRRRLGVRHRDQRPSPA